MPGVLSVHGVLPVLLCCGPFVHVDGWWVVVAFQPALKTGAVAV